METFENEILSFLPNKYGKVDDLISDIAKVHGELLFIHPFREGNGRTARVLANLMCRKQGFGPLKFDQIGNKEFDLYVSAVQNSAKKNYGQMTDFIKSIFRE
ncbi:Fic family protein [Cognataquiflexum rubidum]|uniref:Fic family protein n=1 Tax=Cognataquiflexum rubidum TaxID=2922273 RepID=UPI001F13FDFE|nr:Fic family protein [Cognataquiflexum rubidum]MCH6235024.1 Fic family protein [Cognataquiflexum rubidum]